MATIQIDTSQANANVQKLNSTLDSTKKQMSDVNDEGKDLGKTFDNVGKAANDMNGGINAADQVLDALGKTVGNTNSIAGDAIKSVIPQLKAGLRGTALSFRTLGKAIAATGIGLIIQGIALLITNFKTVTTWVKNFGKAAETSMPGVAKVINKVANAFSNIRDRIRELITNFGNTKFGKWLGLDRAAAKFKAIKDAAEQATAATKAQMNALQEADTKAASRGTTRNQADAIGAVSGNVIQQRSAVAASGVSTTKKTIDDVKVLTDEYKKQSKVLAFLKKLIKEEGDEAAEAAKKQREAAQSTITSIASVAGSIAGMVEENSAAYKALMTVQVIATTAAGAMTAFTAPDNVTMIQKWASFAAVLAAGAAQLSALYSNKLSTSTVTAVTPALAAPMTGAQTAVTTAQITSTQQSKSQVYITEKQLDDQRADNVQLKKNTVW